MATRPFDQVHPPNRREPSEDVNQVPPASGHGTAAATWRVERLHPANCEARDTTSLESPRDIVPWREAPEVSGTFYRVGARSVARLISHSTTGGELPVA